MAIVQSLLLKLAMVHFTQIKPATILIARMARVVIRTEPAHLKRLKLVTEYIKVMAQHAEK